ncbi:MAG: hypothetical protein WKF37_04295 [Bryobacteraceae bacterium]
MNRQRRLLTGSLVFLTVLIGLGQQVPQSIPVVVRTQERFGPLTPGIACFRSVERTVALYPHKTAVVVAGSNQGFETLENAAHKLGMRLIFADERLESSTGVLEPRRRVLDLPHQPLPTSRKAVSAELRPAAFPYSSDSPRSASAKPPSGADFIVGSAQELWNVSRQHSIDTLLYAGIGQDALFSPAGIRDAIELGLNPIVLRDLVHFPLPEQRKPWETAEYIHAKQIRHIEHFAAPTASSIDIAVGPGLQKAAAPLPKLSVERVFTVQEVAAYKPIGASNRFRHFTLDWNWNGGYLDDYLSRVNPVEIAEFLHKVNVDGVVIMSESHHGYTTFLSDNTPSFPSVASRDFYGEVIRECHKRGIAVFGFNSLARNWWFSGEHPEMSWIRKAGTKIEPMLDLNSPYLDYQIGLSKEVLRKYPIDALRYDTLQQVPDPKSPWSQRRYRELYGETMPLDWTKADWRRQLDFQRQATTDAARRLYEGNKSVKPTIEVWQNGFIQQKDFDANNMEAGRFQDMAYIEAGDPFRQLLLTGVLRLKGTIVGHLFDMPSKVQRLCMALGARGYQFKAVNSETLIPDNKEWYYKNVAPFYGMIREIEPYLRDAKPMPYVGVIYSEPTRYRTYGYDRDWYVYGILKPLAMSYLDRSRVIEFVSNLDLASGKYSHLPLIALPESSGLAPAELEGLRRYVKEGGNLLVTGEALRYDPKGMVLRDFALSAEMGVSLAEPPEGSWAWRTMTTSKKTRASIDVARAGEVRLRLWMREAGARVDQIVLTRDARYQPRGAAKTSANEVVIEAEWFAQSTPRSNHIWRTRQDISGFSGSGSIRAELHQPEMIEGATMDQTSALRVDAIDKAPVAEYAVTLPAPGKYYVWVRQSHTNQQDDSVFLGLQPENAMTMDFSDVTHAFGGRGVVTSTSTNFRLPESIDTAGLVTVKPIRGETLAYVNVGNEKLPLLHAVKHGKGSVHYLATTRDQKLLQSVIESIAGPGVVQPDQQVILTRQPGQSRWILHLLSDGDYAVTINTGIAPVSTVAGQYPRTGWTGRIEKTNAGVKIHVQGAATNRLLVLQ